MNVKDFKLPQPKSITLPPGSDSCSSIRPFPLAFQRLFDVYEYDPGAQVSLCLSLEGNPQRISLITRAGRCAIVFAGVLVVGFLFVGSDR